MGNKTPGASAISVEQYGVCVSLKAINSLKIQNEFNFNNFVFLISVILFLQLHSRLVGSLLYRCHCNFFKTIKIIPTQPFVLLFAVKWNNYLLAFRRFHSEKIVQIFKSGLRCRFLIVRVVYKSHTLYRWFRCISSQKSRRKTTHPDTLTNYTNQKQ